MKLLWVIVIVLVLAMPAQAMDFTAPEAPGDVQQLLPKQTSTFESDLMHILNKALEAHHPALKEAALTCLSILAITMLIGIVKSCSTVGTNVVMIIEAILIAVTLMKNANSLIQLGVKTVRQINDYGKVLLPVLAGALAAQGGTTSSATLYTGTAFFSSIALSLIEKFIVPILYVYLCLCIANSSFAQESLKQLKSFVKWLLTWSMKILLYVYMGYISITGVISGSADATAVKAAKLAISGAVPIVGNILSDASETILVSAGVMKNAAGTYGLLVLCGILIGPFLRIGTQYIMLKGTAAVCTGISGKNTCTLIQDYSSAMGYLLAMTGTSCLLFMVSVVCYMKGVSV